MTLEGKTVVFIGGTSYSGSTLLDMLLANDPAGFSCGELHALIKPVRKYHFDPPCGCGDADCRVWQGMREAPGGVHEAVFQRHADVRFVVDSSKSVHWLVDKAREVTAAGGDVKNVLIWKTPGEYFRSREKRGEISGWARSWIFYHRLFLDQVRPFVGVRYAALVNESTTLALLCQRLGLDYFEGKENYWDKKQHTLFGNTSAKIHLLGSNATEFEHMSHELEQLGSNTELKAIHAAEEMAEIDSLCSDSELRTIESILDALAAQDVTCAQPESDPPQWALAGAYLGYQRIMRGVERSFARMR